MKRDDSVYIKHAIDACNKINVFTKDKTRADLDSDEKLSLALIRLLEIIGEASNNLSAEFKRKHSNVPWHKTISMRNRLIHGYFDINYDIVWDTIQNDIPELLKLLKKSL